MPALRELAERSVRARDIASPVRQIAPGRRTADALVELETNGFDVAVLAEEPVGRVLSQDSLRRTRSVRAAARPIRADEIIAGDLPLVRVLELLGTRPHLFVLDEDRVTSIVTRADLNAPGVGVMVLAHLIAIETAITELARNHRVDVLETLPERRREKVRELFEQKRSHNVETDITDCLYFSDWLTVCRRAPGLLDELGTSASRFERRTSRWVEPRNALAHGGTILDGRDPVEAIDLVRDVRLFADEVWTLLDRSVAPWDAYSATIIRRTGSRRPLSGSRGLRRWPWDGSVHVVTAWNPMSRVLPTSENRDRNEALRTELERRGCAPEAVVGVAEDDSWREESLLVDGLDRQSACDLGHRFGQAAVFELEAEHIRVVRCDDAFVIRARPRVPGLA